MNHSCLTFTYTLRPASILYSEEGYTAREDDGLMNSQYPEGLERSFVLETYCELHRNCFKSFKIFEDNEHCPNFHYMHFQVQELT